MRRIAFALIVVSVVVGMPPAYAATPTKFLDDPDVDELSVAVSVDYVAWTANSAARPRHYNSYVMPSGGGDATRVNPGRTRSYSVGIDGSMVAYQVTRRGQGDLAFYDAATDTRSSAPDAVNSDSFESRPSLSGDWLLFSRYGNKPRVILYDLTTDEQRVLRVGRPSTYLVSDQVNGDWATFEYCRLVSGEYRNCNVFRYQISTEELVKIPNPGQQQYAGGVSQDGTVYIARGGGAHVWRCGHHARIVRYPVGGPGVVIAKMRAGRDVYVTFATDEASSTTLYFTRVRCRTQSEGVYSIANADTAT